MKTHIAMLDPDTIATALEDLVCGETALESCPTAGGSGGARDIGGLGTPNGIFPGIEMMGLYGSGEPGQGANAPYRQVAAVRACVYKKAACLAAMPLRISTRDEEILEGGDAFDIAQQPNRFMTQSEFFKATSVFLDLGGECHWVFVDTLSGTALRPGERLREVVPVGRQWMTPRIGRFGELTGWYFSPFGLVGAPPQLLDLAQVWTLKLSGYDIGEPWRGASPLQACGLNVATVYQTDRANVAALKNGLRPSGAVTIPGARPDEVQLNQLRRDWHERYAGADNAGLPLLLYGGADWKQLAQSFTDANTAELKRISVTDICVALEVDPASIGYFEGPGSFGRADAATSNLWMGTTMPRAMWIADEFRRGVIARYEGNRSLRNVQARRRPMDAREQWWSRGFRRAQTPGGGLPGELTPWFDGSQIPAIQAAQLSRSKEAMAWLDKGATLDDLIDAFDLPLQKHAWTNTWWKPIGLVDVQEPDASGGAPGSGDPSGGDGSTTGDADGTGGAADNSGGAGQTTDDTDGTDGEDTPPDRSRRRDAAAVAMAKLATDKTRHRIWEAWRATWQPFEIAVRNKVSRHVYELRSGMLARLAAEFTRSSPPASSAFSAAEKRDLLGRVLFNLQEANHSLLARVGPLLRNSLRLGGEQSMTEAVEAQGKPAEDASPFNIADPRSAALLRQREIRLSGVNATIRKQVATTLSEGLAAGDGQDKLAQRIRDTMDAASNRAATIARTEVGAAVEEGRQVGRLQAKVPLKSWLWSRKETGRPWHGLLEEETTANPIGVADTFHSAETGANAQQPRGFGDPKEDINCGCTSLARYPGDDVRAVIARYASRGFLTVERMLQTDQKRTTDHADGTDMSNASVPSVPSV